MWMKFTTLLLMAALCGVQVDAFWRMECRGRAGLARIDPLMSPDEPSQHVHAIHGSSGFSEAATYADITGANCTSCAVSQDLSVYWAPAMYFKDDATGQFHLVNQVGGMLAYYFLNGENITAFPEGFRMIAGDSLRRNYTAGDGNPATPDPPKSNWAALDQIDQGTLAQRAIGFNCLNYKKAAEGSLYRHFLPDKSYLDSECTDGLRLELMFPSCWNGKDVDSVNHKSHVAYPNLVIDGGCPSDFPVQLPGLFYETIWDTAQFAGQAGKFVMANGDPLGYGYHGDFMMGWKQDYLQQAVNTCTNPSGRIEDCPLFNVIDEDTQRECQMPLPAVLTQENVAGPVPNLPGNVAVQYGPEPATIGAIGSDPTPTVTSPLVPTLTYSAGQTNSASSSFLPGQVFFASTQTAESETPAATSASPEPVPTSASPEPVPTLADPAPAVAAVTSDPAGIVTASPSLDYEAISTQYVTSGRQVSEIIWQEAVVYVTEEDPVTSTVTVVATETAKVRRRGAHFHHHRHAHGWRRR